MKKIKIVTGKTLMKLFEGKEATLAKVLGDTTLFHALCFWDNPLRFFDGRPRRFDDGDTLEEPDWDSLFLDPHERDWGPKMNKTKSKDIQARKYQLTINNPAEHGLDHDAIKAILTGFKSIKYFCMADEVGENEGTPHTHVYAVFSPSPVRFSSIRRAFKNMAHIEVCRGSSEQNRTYILKNQDEENSTFEEFGTIPDERPGSRSDLSELYRQIKAGESTYAILEGNPGYIRHIGLIEKTRQAVAKETVGSDYRNVKVIFIFGAPFSGKTLYLTEKYGDTLYRITDYKNPFDSYTGESVICFDNYAGDFPLRSLLTYTEGYKTMLPRRYSNTWAQFETIYIVSNVAPDKLYKDERYSNPSLWQAYLKRLDDIIYFAEDGKRAHHEVTGDYQIVPVDENAISTGFGGLGQLEYNQPTNGKDYHGQGGGGPSG